MDNLSSNSRQIIIDTETTGMRPEDGNRVIEIGCVEIIDRLLTGEHYHVYINPERLVETEAFKVHGISDEFLQDKPIFSDIVDEFLAFVSGAELIAHNAPFDMNFINHEFKWLNNNYPKIENICTITDSLAIAKKLHPGQRNNLDALCKRYQVNNTNRTLHGALLDAELLAMVYLGMTGGQTSLFGDENTASTILNPKKTTKYIQATDTGIRRTSNINNLNLNIIKANPHECADHDNYLAKLKEKGTCVWGD